MWIDISLNKWPPGMVRHKQSSQRPQQWGIKLRKCGEIPRTEVRETTRWFRQKLISTFPVLFLGAELWPSFQFMNCFQNNRGKGFGAGGKRSLVFQKTLANVKERSLFQNQASNWLYLNWREHSLVKFQGSYFVKFEKATKIRMRKAQRYQLLTRDMTAFQILSVF